MFQKGFDNWYINDGLKEFGRGLSCFSRYSRCFLSSLCSSTIRCSMYTFDHDCAKEFVHSHLNSHRKPSPKSFFYIRLNNSISRFQLLYVMQLTKWASYWETQSFNLYIHVLLDISQPIIVESQLDASQVTQNKGTAVRHCSWMYIDLYMKL